MSIGKTIRLYLADATVTGIRHGEIANWTGQAISCPRSKLQALSEWSEAKRPGVYFLFGTDEDSGQEAVYIGEAEVVFDRLVSHLAQKDFWSEVVAFTSKDDNLTKGHVRYLESRLVEMARQVDRYVVKNGNTPQLPALPRPDRDAMEEYLDASRILLGVLGHRVLEPLVAAPKKTEPEIQGGAAPNPSARTDFILLTAFRLSMSGIQAFATKTDEGFVVMESSEAAKQIQQSLSPGYRTLRDKLIQTHVLVADGEKLRFSRNQLFSSPTQAAAIVLGYSINGREAWRTQNNQSYGALEESIANGSLKLLFDRG